MTAALPVGAVVRPAFGNDGPALQAVHRAAFAGEAEARLVATLLESGVTPRVSLVAEAGGAVVGHILFTPVTVVGPGDEQPALGLAPLAVLPSAQGQGLGAALVRSGLEACARLGAPAVFVLGEPGFYGRFGFEPAARHGLHFRGPEYDAWFQVVALRPEALAGLSGLVRFHPAFDGL